MGFHRDVTPCSLAKLAKGWAAAGMVLLAGAAGVNGQSVMDLHSEWDPPVHDPHLAELDDADAPVDILTWFDPIEEKTWMFVAGVVTTDSGGKAFGVRRFNIDDPDDEPRGPVYYSSLAFETRDHVPAAMSIDEETGDVYIAGYTTNSNSTTDYRIVKLDKELAVDGDWGGDGSVEYDGPEHGNDKAVDIAVFYNGSAKRVFVTGNSWGGTTHLDDIVTIAYETDGTLDWSDRYQGEEEGTDIAVELTMTALATTAGGGFAPVVGGSTWEGSTNGFDIIGIAYHYSDQSPNQRRWVTTWNGPASGL
jgi:hypothetical protein